MPTFALRFKSVHYARQRKEYTTRAAVASANEPRADCQASPSSRAPLSGRVPPQLDTQPYPLPQAVKASDLRPHHARGADRCTVTHG